MADEDDEDDDPPKFLEAEPGVTIVFETSHAPGGGGGGGGGFSGFGPSAAEAAAAADAAAAAAAHQHGSAIQARLAATPAERALEARLKHGDGTPQEALQWFQQHGFPQLQGLPHWGPERQRWQFLIRPAVASVRAQVAAHPDRVPVWALPSRRELALGRLRPVEAVSAEPRARSAPT